MVNEKPTQLIREKSSSIGSFIGLSKDEILDLEYLDFKVYDETCLYLIISESWWGKKKVLFLDFNNNNQVEHQYIRIIYGKIYSISEL